MTGGFSTSGGFGSSGGLGASGGGAVSGGFAGVSGGGGGRGGGGGGRRRRRRRRWWTRRRRRAHRLRGQRQRRRQRQHLHHRIAGLADDPPRVAVAGTVHQAKLAAHLVSDARQLDAQVHGILRRRRAARALHAREQTGVERVGARAAGGRVEVDTNGDAVAASRGRRGGQRQQGGQPDGEAREQGPTKLTRTGRLTPIDLGGERVGATLPSEPPRWLASGKARRLPHASPAPRLYPTHPGGTLRA